MEIQDDFIVGVYNYCDSWCEHCRFTSWCRNSAMRVEAEANADPSLRALVEAPPLGHELPPEPPPWVREFLEDSDEAARDAARQEEHPISFSERMRPRITAEHQLLEDLAHGYLLRLHQWMTDQSGNCVDDPADPRCVISWFGTLFPAKVHRAVRGLTESLAEGPDDWPADYDGSAKIALIAIERSQSAWAEAVAGGLVATDVAAPFVTDLVWLGNKIDRIFPNARSFVRPGLDEPDEVAKLLCPAAEPE